MRISNRLENDRTNVSFSTLTATNDDDDDDRLVIWSWFIDDEMRMYRLCESRMMMMMKLYEFNGMSQSFIVITI